MCLTLLYAAGGVTHRPKHRLPSKDITLFPLCRPPAAKQGVHRAQHPSPAPVQDMGVDHRGTHVRVTQEFLHRSNVVTRFQQVGRKRVAQGMAGGPLGDSRRQDRPFDRSLDRRLVKMMFPLPARTLISPRSRSMSLTLSVKHSKSRSPEP